MSSSPSTQSTVQRTGATELLVGLKSNGIDYLFSNAGTDFPPIIEAFATLPADQVPTPVVVPHETASVAMAHGYYLVTGRPQATMVHVNVGLANSVMGVINAASDNIPVLVLSGRTPLTEYGRVGSRATPIQYGQEMYNQSSLVADVVKFNYEMRYPEQGGMLATRAVTVAMSEPRGPAYISLPREPLTDTVSEASARAAVTVVSSSPSEPDASAVALAADWLSKAQHPLIVCQRSSSDGRSAHELARLAEDCAIPVVEPFTVRNVMATDHPMFLGYDVKGPLAEADVIVVVDSLVPWIEAFHRPQAGKKVIHIGPDPLFTRLPIRGYQTDLAITGDPAAVLSALRSAMSVPQADAERRRSEVAKASVRRKAASAELAQSGAASPMSAEWMSRCLSDIMDERAVVFSELGVVPSCMTLRGPNRVFTTPHSGGLGWGFAAALGAQLADRDRLCIACVGDGSYMFANPVACHQIAEALELPVLVIVKNNGIWNAVRRSVKNSYPQGVATRMNTMPLTSLEPAPDYTMIAKASRAYAERVEHGRDLPAALGRALNVIRTERRLAMLELKIAISDAQ
jgi:acetolactate synthase-1/2/3 large subunit